MENQLVIFRSPIFNNNIYLKLIGFTEQLLQKIKTTEYQLFIGNSLVKSFVKDTPNYLTCSFTDVQYNEDEQYYGKCKVVYTDGTSITLESTHIKITDINFPETKSTPFTIKERYFTTKQNFKKLRDIDKYYISILFNRDGYDKLKNENNLIAYNRIKTKATMKKSFSTEECKNNNLGRFSYHATIKGDLKIDEMIAVTEELSKLEYVKYAVLSPNFEGYEPNLPEVEELSAVEETKAVTQRKNESPDLECPDLEYRQFYLKPTSRTSRGLNVLEAWKRTTGHAATIMLLEGGLRQDHEDLMGNVIVISNASNWERSNNHATACCGIMAAIKNNYGISGIAHNANHFFYNLSNSGLETVLRDVSAGDVISVSLGAPSEIDLPLIVERDWWEHIRDITNKGAIFVLAAGNGGNNITEAFENEFAEDFGDCGVFLAGGCDARDGVRHPKSNYNYHSSNVNAAFDFIYTTGYGTGTEGYGESNGPNSYTSIASGTSFSTPQCAAALALIQSYAIERYNIFFNREQMLDIIHKTGETDAVEDKIGHRPNVDKALSYIDETVTGTF